MLDLKSREYKCMLDPRLFVDLPLGLGKFRKELHQLIRSIQVVIQGKFKNNQQQWVAFLDTADQTLRRNDLLLRRRSNSKNQIEYTLKCRTPDRIIAGHAQLSAASGLKSKSKFEEDIAAPFISRYSQSSTVKIGSKGDRLPPTSLREASQIFPALKELDNNHHPTQSALSFVRDMQVEERVFSGPLLLLNSSGSWGQAKMAVIFWSHQATKRLLVVEFSFRYDLDHRHNLLLAQAASRVFGLIQTLDWCLPASITKTAFMYG